MTLLDDVSSRLLAEASAVLNHKNGKGFAPLHTAVSIGKSIMVEALLEAGAGAQYTYCHCRLDAPPLAAHPSFTFPNFGGKHG